MSTPTPLRLTERLEAASVLDPVVGLLRPLAGALVADPARRDALQGAWLGHALHPVLTDLPIGLWTSASVLDLLGGRAARDSARRLTGLGVLAALPTVLTGWAEWSATEPREQRVGVVHAAANAVAIGLFASSWRARRADRHLRGAALALAGTSAMGLGGYLGGHLVSNRKVSTRHPSMEE